jgi:hypothetical protein
MTTTNDLFKVENESVDRLLKEMDRDSSTVSLEKDSFISSPTKPLKFDYKDKDSSSDTYTSDVDEMFVQPKLNSDDFPTPITSTIDLNGNHKKTNNKDTTTTNNSTEMTKSPSKSALKKSSSLSPKKVAFLKSDPQVHHYPDNRESDNSTGPDVVIASNPVETSWTELSSDDSTPPLPPSHTVSTFETILHSNSNHDFNQHPDSSIITDVKLKHDNFSNLSLNEKLDLFLNQQDGVDKSTNQNSLDTHLSNLECAAKENTSTNINNLSAGLLKQREITPRDHLKSDVQRQLSGSSQSSLQSLRDSNRILQSDNTPIISQALEFNDGIKGFSDELATEIIPTTHESPRKSNSASRIDELRQIGENESAENEFHDSFDRSYLSQSQSIMNLLNSASNLDLPGSFEKEPEIKQEEPSQIKQEVPENVFLETGNTSIKQEEQSSFNFSPVKEKFDSQQSLDRSEIKSEGIEQEDEGQFKVEDMNDAIYGDVHSVSDVERSSSSLKLVSTNLPKNEEITLTPRLFSNTKMEDDEEYDHNDVTRESLRFHMDSDWKLEDSHDGDKEDNDEYTNNDLTFASEKLRTQTNAPLAKGTTAKESQEFEDASASMNNISLDSNRDDGDALANSSNIAPPEEITLPPIEANNYSSFEDITRNLNESANSFEEMLSAENDKDPDVAPNFLSIWHSQKRTKNSAESRSQEYFKILNRDELKEASQATIPMPSSLKDKKFTEVNVMSRRVVSPDFEDLQISNFLPELSEDSGLEGHFNFLEQKNDTSSSDVSNHSINLRAVLRNREHNVLHSSLNPKVLKGNASYKVQADMLRPRSLKFGDSQPTKSRFNVPSFEIKRTNSVLSPTRDMYNDIFEDTVKKPTIKAHGMKTLPSMDHEDVKRILNAKRAISQDEFSKLKLVGNKKNSVVNIPDFYNEQHASICESSTIELHKDSMDEEQTSHVAHQLMQTPRALVSSDQFFHDYDLFNKDETTGGGSDLSHSSSVIRKSQVNSAQTDDHPVRRDVEPVSSSNENGMAADMLAKVPMLVDCTNTGRTSVETAQNETNESLTKQLPKLSHSNQTEFQREIEETNDFSTVPKSSDLDIGTKLTKVVTPVQNESYNISQSSKKKPIKIGSPIKITKNGEGIKVESPKKTKVKEAKSGELVNQKLRDSPRKSKAVEEKEHVPSTVSVPTVVTESTEKEETEANTHTHDYRAAASDEPEELLDNGRLFFRVVGLKNIALKDFRDRDAEFTLSLDNGLHSIRTPPYKLSSYNVMIGKEFELTVNESLQFILTLKMKYNKPSGTLREVRERKVVKSKNRFSRMLGQKDIITTTKFVPFDVRDDWENKFAQDGSFARCYIDLEQYKDSITGKIGTFNINCFNEWETVLDQNKQRVKTKPYSIGQIEVKMLFVPRTDSYEVLPTSMRNAMENVEQLKKEATFYKEGYMHQEGGDCDIWKRRFYKLTGTSLIAHSEFSHKSRAKINLSKVVDVIYIDKENTETIKKYRNFSDFAILDHAFKIKFANGEIIGFSASSHDEKVEWIKLIETIITRNKFRRQPWVKVMLQASQDRIMATTKPLV